MAHKHSPLGRALLDTLDVLPVGIVVLAERRVIAANREAKRLLTFGSRAADEAFAAAGRAAPRLAFRLNETGVECLAVRLGTRATALFLCEPDHVALDAGALQELHDLTPGEVRIVNQLTNGLSLAEIADELCLSAHTVRTHLRSVFAKTGTRGQADLIRFLLCGAARISSEIPQTSDAE